MWEQARIGDIHYAGHVRMHGFQCGNERVSTELVCIPEGKLEHDCMLRVGVT